MLLNDFTILYLQYFGKLHLDWGVNKGSKIVVVNLNLKDVHMLK